MGRACSNDLRSRIYGEISEGQSCRAAARRFGVSASTGVRMAQRVAETGTLSPCSQSRPPGTGKLMAYREMLIGWIEAEPDISMPELAAKLEAKAQVVMHLGLEHERQRFAVSLAGDRHLAPGKDRARRDRELITACLVLPQLARGVGIDGHAAAMQAIGLSPAAWKQWASLNATASGYRLTWSRLGATAAFFFVQMGKLRKG